MASLGPVGGMGKSSTLRWFMNVKSITSLVQYGFVLKGSNGGQWCRKTIGTRRVLPRGGVEMELSRVEEIAARCHVHIRDTSPHPVLQGDMIRFEASNEITYAGRRILEFAEAIEAAVREDLTNPE